MTLEEALSRLVVQPGYDAGHGPGDCVHTFREAGPAVLGALLGAYWYLHELREAMERYGVEEAGHGAASMGHTLVLIDDRGPLFIEARPRDEADMVARPGRVTEPWEAGA